MTKIKMTLITLLVMMAFVVAPVYGGGGAADNGMQHGETRDPDAMNGAGGAQDDQWNDTEDDEWEDEQDDQWQDERDQDEWEEDPETEQPGQERQY